jgi:hypothetical protein
MADRKSGVFEIKTENLILDQFNPRLYGESATESQEQIMNKIYQKESIDELASSLAVNGYFQEEPIIVIPEKPDDFDKIDITNINNFKYIVIEGNRRTTSVKLLLNTANTIVDKDFPKILEGVNLNQIPAIIYKNRDDVDTYLSVRHISGNRKWDAFAKAKYIFEKVNKINEGTKDVSKAIEILSTQIGDKSNIVKKYYIYYKVFQQIEADVLTYSSRHIKDRFSLLEVSLASGNTTIANYIGLPPFRKIDLEDDLIKPNKVDELKNVTEWIFGTDDQGNNNLISDSRLISSVLKPILGNKEAIEHLVTYKDLDGAYQLTGGEEQLVIGNINRSKKLLSNILAKVPKYKENKEFIGALEELLSTIDSVKKLME